jgi:MFS family permease
MAYEVSGSSSKLVNQAIGYLNTCISFSVIFGPTISGYYFQKYNNYEIGYNLTIGTLLVAMFIQLLYPDLFFIKFLKKKLFKNKKNNPMVLYRF